MAGAQRGSLAGLAAGLGKLAHEVHARCVVAKSGVWVRLLAAVQARDAARLREQFALPASIWVYQDGYIKDSLNRVDIRPAPSYQTAPKHTI